MSKPDTTHSTFSGILEPIPSNLADFLALYPSGVKAIALAAREMVVQTQPEATDTVDRSARLVGYGYGPGYKDTICTLLLSQAGVKVGIARGSELPDPIDYCSDAEKFTAMCSSGPSLTSQNLGG